MTPAVTLSRLKALRGSDGLSRRVSDRIDRLIDRLDAPVRVGVFGLPGAGKAEVVNLLSGAEMLEAGTQSIPTLLRWAEQPQVDLIQADGSSATMALEIPFIAPPGALFAELGAALDPLREVTFLTVAAEAAPRDMMAAMAWAAPRCDIALWCTRHWREMEGRVWAAGPDGLKNHAILVATDGEDALDRARAAFGFEEHVTCSLSPAGEGDGPLPDCARTLRQRLAAMIETARGADLDAAAVLLERHAPATGALGAPSARSPAPAPARTAPAAPSRPETPPPEVSQLARTVLSRMVWQVRHTARDLATEAPDSALTEDAAARVLARLQATFDTLIDLADADDAFADEFPALHSELLNAHELVQLLKIEGQPMQATEGVILLSQMRREVCHALAV